MWKEEHVVYNLVKLGQRCCSYVASARMGAVYIRKIPAKHSYIRSWDTEGGGVISIRIR